MSWFRLGLVVVAAVSCWAQGCGGAANTSGAPAGSAGQTSGTSSGGSGAGQAGGGTQSGGASAGMASGGLASGGADGGMGGGGLAGEGGMSAGASGLIDCDPKKILCKRVAPQCAPGEVPSVAGSCYGDCVKVEQCACSVAAQCPQPNQYTCWAAEHCGPFVR